MQLNAKALALLSILHALLLFFVFVFDLVFIEKLWLAKTRRRVARERDM